ILFLCLHWHLRACLNFANLDVCGHSLIKKAPDGAADSDEYRSRFLKVKLSGARRQTYINDTLYRTVAKVLPVIAPEMSVPMFLGSVLSDHLERYQHIINEIYNQEATQKPIEWKK
ncbi:DUF3408 domain-containing protein, partial [Phocaeicola massiliensis]|uniref:DUF3408 domain-containing protein n=1 Tax=Phocaeicola massiliensis TaxID=204516 RepID=UPI00207A9B12